MSAADLIALGCPKLPPGHLYRLFDSFTRGMMLMQIRRDVYWLGLRVGSRLVAQSDVDRYYDRTADRRYRDVPLSLEQAIAEAAVRAYEHRQDQLDIARWEGDHR